jgi:hypothetical protein
LTIDGSFRTLSKDIHHVAAEPLLDILVILFSKDALIRVR